MNDDWLPAPLLMYANEGKPLFRVENREFPEGTRSPFNDCTIDCCMVAKNVVRLDATREVWFVHYRFTHLAKDSIVSKSDNFGFATWNGGGGPAWLRSSDFKIWAKVLKLKPSVVHAGCNMCYRVDVFETHAGKSGKKLIEKYFFPDLPPEAAKLKAEKAKLRWLGNFIKDAATRKNQVINAAVAAQALEHFKKFPAHNPAKDYGVPDFDHYANQRQILLNLLREKWPRFSAALEKLRTTQTQKEKEKGQMAVWIGYITDYKARFKILPEINEKDFLDLLKNEPFHDHYVRLMGEALGAGREDEKRDWQLATGWIERNYYRMNERDLEVAFARDWNCPPGLNKGHALATRAHRLGLVSFLTPGPKK